MQLSVIVPVFNEAGNLLPLLEEIHAALESHGDFEVIFVDDGSSDDSPQRLAAALADHPRLRVLRHDRRSGQSAALRSGVEAARGDWIATLDGDGQNDPADIPRSCCARRASGTGGALAAGRLAHPPPGQPSEAPVLAPGQWPAQSPAAAMPPPIPAAASSCFPASHLPAVALVRPHAPLPARPGAARRRPGDPVPVSHRPRRAGRSKYGVHNRLWVGLVDLLGVLWLQRRMRRVEVTELNAGSRRSVDSEAA
jgi:dolichol-phosphate mannosyltransferase